MYRKYLDYLKENLKEKRYIHSLNVAEECAVLAERYGYDKQKAYLCGLLHDICKNDSEEKMLQIFNKFGIILDNVQSSVNLLWHSIAGAVVVKEKFGITDTEFLNAIKYHTTGRENMTKLEKIVYLADVISADRNFEGVEKLRQTSKIDLDLAVLDSLKSCIENLTNKKQPIHLDTIKAYNSMILERM